MTCRWGAMILLLVLLASGARQRQQASALAHSAAPLVLPAHLSQTGLFVAGSADVVSPGNRPFAPQYPLWSDGATKRRWIHLPAGTTIDGGRAGGWVFPAGTRLWKEFSFAGRRIETRVLWKGPDSGWLAGSYRWNDAGTDAILADEQGLDSGVEVASGRQHVIPSRSDCGACHGVNRAPLGFNALQLSSDRDPNAIHGEPLTAGSLTLATLLEEGLLSNAAPELRAPPRIAAADPPTRAILGYLAANCGSCHNGDASITALMPSLSPADLVREGDAIVRRMAGQPSRWQPAGNTDGTLLIDPGSPQTSAIVLRMQSRRPSAQMPPLGSVLQDRVALDALRRWIASLPRSGEGGL